MNTIHLSVKDFLRAACVLAAMVGSLLTMSAAQADATTNFSQTYTEECLSKGVPLPPVWGTVNNFWKYTGQLSSSEVFVDRKTPTDIYYFVSDSTNNDFRDLPGQTGGQLHLYLRNPSIRNPEGVCMAAVRKAPNTHTCEGVSGLNYTEAFSVICQGKNGNACFWSLKKGNTIPWSGPVSGYPEGKAILPSYSGTNKQCLKTTVNPNGKMTDFAGGTFLVPNFDLYITQYAASSEGFDNRTAVNSFPTWVGGASLVGNNEGICTACHAGENVFINHPGSATDINPLSAGKKTNGTTLPHVPLNFYFPSNWPNPIIPASDPLMSGSAWPQNSPPIEHYKALHPTSGCFGCHGERPAANSTQTAGRFPKISDLAALDSGTNYCHNVFYPSVNLTSGTGVMPPGSTTKARDNDSFAKAMWYNVCVSTKAPKSAENGVTAAMDSTRGKIHKSSYQSGFHEHGFTGKVMPSANTFFGTHDKICVDGFVSSSSNLQPAQIVLQFYANDGPGNDTWNHRAYWGTDKLAASQWPNSPNGSVGNFQVSNKVTPKGRGYWNQYCVKAGSVGLAQKNISGIKFTLSGGAMWWGNVYYYNNGGGTPRSLFTMPSGVTKTAAGGDFWQTVNTPAYLFWNPATWHHLVSNEGTYQMDQTGNIDLGPYKDNYCYMNSLALRAGDQISLTAKRLGGPVGTEWWSLGANFNDPSGVSTIGANCIPWKELTTGVTRDRTTIPPVIDSGMFFASQSAGVNGQQNSSPPPSIQGGWPSTNLCVLNGLNGAFSNTTWSQINLEGVQGSFDSTAWFWNNKTPQGYTMCGNIGIGTLSPVPPSASIRGITTWYNLNQQWSGSGGSIDLSGAGKDASNQFCYLAGLSYSAAVPSIANPSVYVVVADGTTTYTDRNGVVIPAGRWVVWGQNGTASVKIGCQSTPI